MTPKKGLSHRRNSLIICLARLVLNPGPFPTTSTGLHLPRMPSTQQMLRMHVGSGLRVP